MIMAIKAEDKRSEVAAKYATIIGRNIYSQALRNYCYTPYTDGNYYSDCSSSICRTYTAAGYGFGSTLNTAGMYNSDDLEFVDVEITNGIPDHTNLRVGDMLFFKGTDSSRPLCIGHVEMVYSINDDGTITLCGHGSGTPSFKDCDTYCKTRYNSWASGGWRKQLVCIKRYIPDDEEFKSGWYEEDGGWRYYLGDTGECVKSDWVYNNNHWYYFNSEGLMYACDWLYYNDHWYYFNEDGIMYADRWGYIGDKWYYFDEEGIMLTGLQSINGSIYALGDNGAMLTSSVVCEPDESGALRLIDNE